MKLIYPEGLIINKKITLYNTDNIDYFNPRLFVFSRPANSWSNWRWQFSIFAYRKPSVTFRQSLFGKSIDETPKINDK